MKSHLFMQLTALGILIFLCPESARPADKLREVQLEGLPVTMALKKNSDTEDWPKDAVRLVAKSVPVDGKTIQELLLEAHVFPDVESFTVVYELNPEIQDLSELEVSQVRIPKLEGANLESIFAKGFQVLLTVEKEKKQQFNDSVQRLSKSVAATSKLSTERFQDEAAKKEIIASLASTVEILVLINERIVERFGRPVPRVVLSELYTETQMVESVLNSKAAPAAKFDQSDLDMVKQIETDLKRKGRNFKEVAGAGDAPPRYTQVEVSVKTLKAGVPVPNLRIYYVAKLLRRNSKEFGKFGTLSTDKLDAPAKGLLYEADYCFWAAKDPSTTAVTNEQCQGIYLDAKVELTVIH